MFDSAAVPSDSRASWAHPQSSQLVALFPAELHTYFFVGTFLVSFCMAPLNVALGAAPLQNGL